MSYLKRVKIPGHSGKYPWNYTTVDTRPLDVRADEAERQVNAWKFSRWSRAKRCMIVVLDEASVRTRRLVDPKYPHYYTLLKSCRRNLMYRIGQDKYGLTPGYIRSFIRHPSNRSKFW